MRIRWVAGSLLVIGTLSPATSWAQRLSDARIAFGNVGTLAAATAPRPERPNRGSVVANRFLASVLGMGAGVLLGAALGDKLVDSECDGEICIPVGSVLLGAAVTILGAAAGAATPSFESMCGGGQRFARGLAGSILGAGVGSAVMLFVDPKVGLVVTVVTLPLGAAVLQGPC